MASLAFMAPLLPGGEDRLQALAAALAGPRRAESARFHRRIGLAAEHWYLQPTVRGMVVIVYLEGPDLAHSLQSLAQSQAPFDRWFRAEVRAVHGIDFTQTPRAPLPLPLYRWAEL